MIKQDIIDFLSENNSRKILIHSDVLFGFKITYNKDKNIFLNNHLEKINSVIVGKDLFFPTFNYDFCGGKDFSLLNSKSQVGVLSEYFRQNKAVWRTVNPIFSFSGTGEKPNLNKSNILDPFGYESVFHYLYENGGAMMHYGASFNSSTILHYVERISGKLTYRYDKTFSGNVILENGLIENVKLNYHVRPLNMYQDYDWPKLESELIKANILHIFKEGRTRILICSIRRLVDFWLEKMNADSLYLLDEETKKWVEPMLDKLGRPFLISDFE